MAEAQMSAHLQRANLLMQQGRFADAREFLGKSIAESPENPVPYALMAICLLNLDRKEDALQAARDAVAHAPDYDFAHNVLATVLHHLDREKEALGAIEEAIRLDPEESNNFSVRASILLHMKKWEESVASAQEGLRLDPENLDCLNIQSQALTQLGRREEAGRVLQGALARNPENSATHANEGWRLLHAGKPAESMTHFREALRLDPNLEYARSGMIEALKARYFIYRMMLAYYLWMSRLSSGAQWAIMLGLYFGAKIIRQYSRSNPAFEPYGIAILILYGLFVFLSWTASPLFNLALFLNPFGRMALDRRERIGAAVVGGCLASALGCVAAGILLKISGFFVMGIVLLLATLPTAAVANTTKPKQRMMVGGATVLLVCMGLAGAWVSGGATLIGLYFLGVFLLTLGINAMNTR